MSEGGSWAAASALWFILGLLIDVRLALLRIASALEEKSK